MSTRLFGYRRSGTSTTTSDVIVTDYDDGWGIDSISTPVAFQKTWFGDDITIFGENKSIGTSYEDCSCMNSDNTYMCGILSSGLMVSSNNTADQMISGGIHAICVEYLDSNWNQRKATVELSGQKPVYIGDMFRPQRMYAVKVGLSGTAIGSIVLASSNNQYLKIPSNKNVSQNGYYYVANGKELMVTDSFASPIFGCKDAMEFKLVKEEPRDFNGTTYYVETESPMGTTVETYTVMNLPLPIVMPYSVKEKCRIRLRVVSAPVTAGAGLGSGQAYIRGYLVDKRSN
jgi:hypothetical protein